MASSLMSNFLQHRLAAPLSIWGKLPSHGDFLRHGVTPAQAQDWQAWVARVWHFRHHTDSSQHARALRKPKVGWLQLEAQTRGSVDLGAVPVAFVMLPGALPFAPRHYLQGVILDSEDSVGRACPIVIYQQVARGWMERLLTEQLASPEKNLLYWLSRVAARTHAAQADWTDLTRAVDELWQLHCPGWQQWLSLAPPRANLHACAQVLQRYCPSDSMDAAMGLSGVRSLPWRNWPERVLRPQRPVSAYWQQDIAGGYVNASESLLTLWKGLP